MRSPTSLCGLTGDETGPREASPYLSVLLCVIANYLRTWVRRILVQFQLLVSGVGFWGRMPRLSFAATGLAWSHVRRGARCRADGNYTICTYWVFSGPMAKQAAPPVRNNKDKHCCLKSIQNYSLNYMDGLRQRHTLRLHGPSRRAPRRCDVNRKQALHFGYGLL